MISSIDFVRIHETTRKYDAEEYFFVEQPSDEYFCPLTRDLLLVPYLTDCCGKHVSSKVAKRMEEEGVGEECPICHSSQWNLMIDKNYQCKVNSIKVFCSHREKRMWVGRRIG